MSYVDLENVRQHIEILRWCKARTGEIKELEKQSRAAVEEAMGSHDIGLLDGEPAIHWTTYKENRFDQTAFREDHDELFEQYKTAREKRRFEVLDG